MGRRFLKKSGKALWGLVAALKATGAVVLRVGAYIPTLIVNERVSFMRVQIRLNRLVERYNYLLYQAVRDSRSRRVPRLRLALSMWFLKVNNLSLIAKRIKVAKKRYVWATVRVVKMVKVVKMIRVKKLVKQQKEAKMVTAVFKSKVVVKKSSSSVTVKKN